MMGRLIDTDEVLSYIEHVLHTGLGKKKSLEYIMKFIEKSPVAYDPEEVVKQIKEKAFPDFEEEYTCNGEQLLYLSDVLDIVRKGGAK